MNNKKSILKSKTFWVNLLMATAVIVPELANIPELQLSTATSISVASIVNMVLRVFFTDKGIISNGI